MKRKLMLLAGATAMALTLTACGDDNGDENNNTNDNSSGPDFSTQTGIFNFLDGKTLTMDGANVPNFFDQPFQDFCIESVVIDVTGQTFSLTTDEGTIAGGDCDQETVSDTRTDTSTAVSFTNIENEGECFDVDITYASGVTQEGRGSLTSDGSELRLDLVLTGTGGFRCADGAVGSTQVNGLDVTQVYVID